VFIYRLLYPRDSHSFPTRRSSDLRFTRLSMNLSLEMVVRMGTLLVMVLLGYKVGGAMLAIVAGVGAAYLQGGLALLDVLRTPSRSEEHTSELQSPYDLVCRLLLEK